MDLLPFGKLPPFRARSFVPIDAQLGDWACIEPLFDRLEMEAARCNVVEDFESWLRKWSEVSSAIDEESSRRYIAMTCHTDEPTAESSYLHFVEEIEPKLKPRQFKLSQLYLAHPMRQLLPKDRYAVLDRDVALAVELFRPENVPLETEEAKIGQHYQKLSGSLTVEFRGEEKTLTQMGRLLEETDRSLREEAWKLVAARRLQETEKFEDFFDALINVRSQIAKNAGFANYRDYAFRARGRFDYTPQDCLNFHDAIEAEVVPLQQQLHQERREQLKLDVLRPWDTAVDPLGRAPLRPFETVDQMVEISGRIFHQIDPRLGSQFDLMRERKLLDLDNRKGKAPGGYQSSLCEARLPFIFMNAVGVQRDVETLLHEAGHAFHALATQKEDLQSYRSAPIEFCEVASMSMELLGSEFLEEFYPQDSAHRARRTHLDGIVGVFPWIASIDAFQHWIYTHEGHTREERRAAWSCIMTRFGGGVDWTGLERERDYLWHRQLHVFLYPFYYVEYGIAQLGALQVWRNSRKHRTQALENYLSGLALGGSKPLPELFARAGCRFDFGRETMRPLMAEVKAALGR